MEREDIKKIIEDCPATTRGINEVIVHCAATPEGKWFTADDIDSWHKERGFKGIGYHFVIDLDGTIEVGRDLKTQGAHCTLHNAKTIGICYIGGYDKKMAEAKDTRTENQKASMKWLLETLAGHFPIEKISGHRDYAKKDCPCFDATTEYKDIRHDQGSI